MQPSSSSADADRLDSDGGVASARTASQIELNVESVNPASPIAAASDVADAPASRTGANAIRESTSAERIVAVYSFELASSRAAAFYEWLRGIGSELEQSEGFINRELFLPPPETIDSEIMRVTVIIFFDTQEHLDAWQNSPERAAWIDKATAAGLFEDDESGKGMGKTYASIMACVNLEQPAPKAFPPPRWKLSVLIWFCVVTTVIVSEGAGFSAALAEAGIGLAAGVLITLFTSTVYITYAFLPLVTEFPPVDKWLRQPPPRLHVVGWKGIRGCAAAIAYSVLGCLNDGISLFNPAPPQVQDPEMVARITRLEKRLEYLKLHHHERLRAVAADIEAAGLHSKRSSTQEVEKLHEDMKAESTEVLAKLTAEAERQRSNSSDPRSFVVSVQTTPKWECLEDYKELQEEMVHRMATFPGYMSCTFIAPPPTSLSEQLVYRIVYRFDTREHLSAWLFSKERAELLHRLAPLLVTKEAVAASTTRFLPDSFSDLFIPQGVAAPPRPPPKWKVTILTTVALWTVTYPTSKFISPRLTDAGIENLYALLTVTTMITVSGNSYVVAPIFTSLVGHWLQEPRPSYVNSNIVWRVLDEGLRRTLTQAVVTLVWFLACGAAWIAKSANE